MANLKRGEVDIHIGGEKRVLKFDFNALCELEELFGKPVQEIFVKGNVGMRVIRDSIFVGLKGSTANLTAALVGYWIQDEIEKLEEYTGILTTSLYAALGKAGEPEVDPTPAPGKKPKKKARKTSGASTTTD